MNRDDWFDYFCQFQQGMQISFKVHHRSSFMNKYKGKVTGTMNVRKLGFERWLVQLDVFDFTDGQTKPAYIDSYWKDGEYIKEFYFQDNHYWRPTISIE